MVSRVTGRHVGSCLDAQSVSHSTPRTLPDTAIVGPGRREPLWIHGSLSVLMNKDETPLGSKVKRRRVEMVERGSAERESEKAM